MNKVLKTYPVHELKADAAGEGIVEAIISVFGNVDKVGDRVVRGAFDKTIADWAAKNENGRYLPFTDEHDWSRQGRIGKVLEMAETDEGLWVKARLFMNQQSAQDVYHQIKEGVLGEFSFAYDVVQEKKAKDGANDLLELGLLDAAAALHGANSETRLVSVKDGLKVGRVLSSKNETDLRSARDLLDQVLSQISNEDGKDTDMQPQGTKSPLAHSYRSAVLFEAEVAGLSAR